MALTQVKTTGLADDAVTLAKQAAGTDGQIITYDASGNPTAVGPGTDGQVLTSTGAGSPPAFEALPASNNYVHPNHSGEVTSTADGATVIASDIVDEDNLKVSNSPTNGYFLSAQSGNTGGLTWAAAGGANVLQVKMATQGNSDIQSSFSSQTLTDMLSVTITPTATSSKFLVFANYRGYKNGAAILTLNTGLVRNVDGGAFTELYAKNWDPVLQYTDNNAKSVHSNHFYLDAPSYSSGNALIYKSQAASGNGDSIDVGRFTELLVIELASGTAP